MHFYLVIILSGLALIAHVSSSVNNVFYNVSVVHDISYGDAFGTFGARSMLDCTRRCSRTSSCRSVKFAIAQRLCSINRQLLDPAIAVPCVPGDGCPQHWGRMYAKKHVQTTMRQPCLYDYDCVDPMSECRRDICTCVPGYSYNRTSFSCVTACTSYGTSFQLKLGYMLNNNNEETHITTRDICMELCLSATTFVCRTVEYYPQRTDVKCALSSITAYTRPDIYQNMSGAELYTRDCL